MRTRAKGEDEKYWKILNLTQMSSADDRRMEIYDLNLHFWSIFSSSLETPADSRNQFSISSRTIAWNVMKIWICGKSKRAASGKIFLRNFHTNSAIVGIRHHRKLMENFSSPHWLSFVHRVHPAKTSLSLTAIISLISNPMKGDFNLKLRIFIAAEEWICRQKTFKLSSDFHVIIAFELFIELSFFATKKEQTIKS